MAELLSDPILEIRLTRAQALVLFEFLARETDPQKTDETLTICYPAEERVLWAVEGQLEKRLVEIFSPGYSDHLRLARESIMASE